MLANSLLTAPLPTAPWGTLIGVYLVMIGLPSGLGLLSWWLATQPAIAGISFERRAHLVALGALLVVSGLLVIDLGRPGGFYLMLTRFDNLTSPISVGAKLVALKMALLAVAIYAGRRHRRRVSAAVGSGGGASAPPARGPTGAALRPVTRTLLTATSFALAIYPAALLSHTWSSPLGATSGAALLFLTTSLLLGAAAAVVIVTSGTPPPGAGEPPAQALLRRLLLVLLVGHAITIAFQTLATAGDPRLAALVAALATGGYALPWWLGVVGAGIAIPITALLLFPRQRSALLLAAVGAVVGAGTTRYLLFAVGGVT